MSRIHILPAYLKLPEQDRERAEGVVRDIVSAWNRTGMPKIGEEGTVLLERDSPGYRQLREHFLSHVKVRGVDPDWVKWSEVADGVYSDEELAEFGVLTLYINADAGLGGNEYAPVYETKTCRSCGVIIVRRQLQDLVMALEGVRSDFSRTSNFGEVIVTDRVKDVLADTDGVELRPIRHVDSSRRARRAYFQLIVHSVMKPLLSDTPRQAGRCPECGRVYATPSDDADRPDLWTEIHQWGPGPWSEMRFPRAAYRGWDLMRTEELFGSPTPSTPSPQWSILMVSQRLRQMLRKHRLTGFWFQPARLIPSSAELRDASRPSQT